MPIPELTKKSDNTNNESETGGQPISNKNDMDDAYARSQTNESETSIPLITPEETPMKKRSKKNKKTFKKRFLKFIGILFVLGIVSLFAVINLLTKNLPDPTKINEVQIAESTVIYDRTGEHILFQFFGDEKRTFLPLSSIPIKVQLATLVAEDRDFYSHKGIKITSIIRAVLTNLTNFELTGQGGSTITQQFVKNAILTPEKTYTRKLKEAILSWQLEQKFTKDQILELYLNEIPYGSTAYGIEAASENYFEKRTEELTLGEAAILAALPKAPTFYSPYGNNKEELIGRQHFILDVMVEEGHITEAERDEAKEEVLEFKPQRENINAPHFVFWLKEQLSEKYGDRVLEQGGLKIWSTIDLELQERGEEILAEQVEKNAENYDATNAALVAIDPKTGQILTMIGSKDYFDVENDGNVNVAARPRQPGSSFKPVVYAAAFTKGFTPETKVFDVLTTFETEIGKPYAPVNYDLSERGVIALRHAFAGSLNIPAVKVLYMTGIDTVLNLAESLGYTTLSDRSRFGLSLVLGGGEIKLVEHTAAFGAFAQDGEQHQTTGVLRIEDREGKVIEEYQEKSKKVIDTNIARIVNSVLSSPDDRAVVFGYNSALTIPGRQAAAKTGTTNKFIDSWTMGYTPNLAVGVWTGNNDNTPMRVGAYGGTIAAPIWKKFMIEALEGMPVESFTAPADQEASNPILNGEGFGEHKVTIDRVSGKLATEYTPEELRVEKSYFSPHSILHYVDVNNPNGNPPENPEQDMQYQAWEEAIKVWAEENDALLEEPPTEFDDIHLPENQPKITLTSPGKSQTITNTSINATVSVQTKGNPINFVEYKIDGRPIGRAQKSPYSYTINMGDFPNGWHTLTADVRDTVSNKSSDSVTFNLNLTRTEPGLLWISPFDQSVITLNEFPLAVRVQTPTPELITNLSIQARDLITNQVTKVGETITISDGNEKIFTWNEEFAHPSTWQLEALLDGGEIKKGPTFLVNPKVEEKPNSEPNPEEE